MTPSNLIWATIMGTGCGLLWLGIVIFQPLERPTSFKRWFVITGFTIGFLAGWGLDVVMPDALTHDLQWPWNKP